jgi:hypothetical protein
MRNHLHLVVETHQDNLVAGMKWFPGSCTARFNRLPVRAARRQGGTSWGDWLTANEELEEIDASCRAHPSVVA